MHYLGFRLKEGKPEKGNADVFKEIQMFFPFLLMYHPICTQLAIFLINLGTFFLFCQVAESILLWGRCIEEHFQQREHFSIDLCNNMNFSDIFLAAASNPDQLKIKETENGPFQRGVVQSRCNVYGAWYIFSLQTPNRIDDSLNVKSESIPHSLGKVRFLPGGNLLLDPTLNN